MADTEQHDDESAEQGGDAVASSSADPAAPAAVTPASGARRPKFRDRSTVPPQSGQASPGAGAVAPPSRRIRGLIAAVAAVVIIAIVLVQALRGNSTPASTPVTGATSSGSTGASTNSNPAGTLTAVNGAALAAQPIIPAGGGGHLIEPHEAVVGPGGDIYVSDPGSHAVDVYTPGGRYVRSLQRSGNVQAMTPFSLTTCPNGHLYVLDDSDNGAVARLLDYQGAGTKLVQSFGSGVYLSRGRGLACDSAGSLYVSNPADNSIAVYNSASGSLVQNRQTPLSSVLGQYNQPSALAIGPGNTIFVFDDANSRIEEFNAQWQPLGQWPAPPSDTYHTAHIFVTGKDSFLVSDPSGSLLDYNLSTQPATITRHSLAGVKGVTPLGIARLDKSHVLVTDVANKAVWSVALP